MAVTRDNNVIAMAADGDTIVGHHLIKGIKVAGGGSGATINLRRTDASGMVLYTKKVAADTDTFEEVDIRNHGGTLYLDVDAGGGTVTLYLK